MPAFNYNPVNLKLPELPKLQVPGNINIPKTNISNNFARNILETLGSKIQAPTAFTQNNRLEDQLYPTQELGRQFIQNNLLPEFQRNTLNPFLNQQANRLASSNASLLGNAQKMNQAELRQVTQPFEDQALNIQDVFNDQAQNNLRDMLKSYYDTQLNF